MTDEQKQELIQHATEAAEKAYVPYSNYRVGAALRAADGSIYSGCNIENGSYSACICAERTALVKAVSEGQRKFVQMAVVTRNGGFPCGICRQMLFEFAPQLHVIIADTEGNILNEASLADLLPHGFALET